MLHSAVLLGGDVFQMIVPQSRIVEYFLAVILVKGRVGGGIFGAFKAVFWRRFRP